MWWVQNISLWDCILGRVCFQLNTGSCDGTKHDVIIFGHHVINFNHKIYYKTDHRRIQCLITKYQWAGHRPIVTTQNTDGDYLICMGVIIFLLHRNNFLLHRNKNYYIAGGQRCKNNHL